MKRIPCRNDLLPLLYKSNGTTLVYNQKYVSDATIVWVGLINIMLPLLSSEYSNKDDILADVQHYTLGQFTHTIFTQIMHIVVSSMRKLQSSTFTVLTADKPQKRMTRYNLSLSSSRNLWLALISEKNTHYLHSLGIKDIQLKQLEEFVNHVYVGHTFIEVDK